MRYQMLQWSTNVSMRPVESLSCRNILDHMKVNIPYTKIIRGLIIPIDSIVPFLLYKTTRVDNKTKAGNARAYETI